MKTSKTELPWLACAEPYLRYASDVTVTLGEDGLAILEPSAMVASRIDRAQGQVARKILTAAAILETLDADARYMGNLPDTA